MHRLRYALCTNLSLIHISHLYENRSSYTRKTPVLSPTSGDCSRLCVRIGCIAGLCNGDPQAWILSLPPLPCIESSGEDQNTSSPWEIYYFPLLSYFANLPFESFRNRIPMPFARYNGCTYGWPYRESALSRRWDAMLAWRVSHSRARYALPHSISPASVSYTHLDVYKRQNWYSAEANMLMAPGMAAVKNRRTGGVLANRLCVFMWRTSLLHR